MAMEGKTLRNGNFYDESGKRHEKGQQTVQDQKMAMEKSWVMMVDRTDKNTKSRGSLFHN